MIVHGLSDFYGNNALSQLTYLMQEQLVFLLSN